MAVWLGEIRHAEDAGNYFQQLSSALTDAGMALTGPKNAPGLFSINQSIKRVRTEN